jgi:N-acetyl-beta-hexosaminidase
MAGMKKKRGPVGRKPNRAFTLALAVAEAEWRSEHATQWEEVSERLRKLTANTTALSIQLVEVTKERDELRLRLDSIRRGVNSTLGGWKLS